ncbi:hypothetical protein DTO195F2_1213 [Paecilomyces variotii]|nr:hypothetical protein DTO195F2_1213 [Paecilomyces variotii]KAJ9369275.1 hypothetical protein DTO282E5_6072 [Paecilomyces variotii]
MSRLSPLRAVLSRKYACSPLSTRQGPVWASTCRRLQSTSSESMLDWVQPAISDPKATSNSQTPAIPLRSSFSTSNLWNTKDPIRKITLNTEKIGRRDRTYPTFWLRDHCQCSECVHPDTKQRIVDTFSIPEDVDFIDVSYEEESTKIKWSDGHTGVYPHAFLKEHQFGSRRTPLNPLTFRPFESVKSDSKTFPTVSYDSVMENDQGVLEWIEQIHKWGFCFVKGVPIDPEKTKTLIERIAFIRPTHYGGFWDFTSDLTFKDTAYTSEFLGAHTDNTYFTDPSRLQLFHLLSHTHGEGGASLLVDGFKAAEVLLRENHQHAEILGCLQTPAHSSGNESVCIQPVYGTHVFHTIPRSRQLYMVRWNNYDRAPKSDWNLKQQKAWYDAARHWNEIIKRPEMEIWTQLEPGTALIFDNWRMLHGRSEFTGKRRMCGGYVNNDDFVSRHRLLKFGRERALNTLGVYPDPLDWPQEE